jgi:hypothetical protein
VPSIRKSGRLGLVFALLAAAVAIDLPAQDPAAQASHRPLRSNASADPPEPTEPGRFTGYAGATDFTVVAQKHQLMFFPCSGCHSALPPNPSPRLLSAPHPAALPHGSGRFWCLDCHQTQDRDQLRTLSGESVDFDQAYRVCGQCHSRQEKDWYFGAHGKRATNWSGPREIYNCTHCHDPHDPVTKPRPASPPPPVRAGLEPMPRHAAPQGEKKR